jgi:hypothetical protein
MSRSSSPVRSPVSGARRVNFGGGMVTRTDELASPESKVHQTDLLARFFQAARPIFAAHGLQDPRRCALSAGPTSWKVSVQYATMSPFLDSEGFERELRAAFGNLSVSDNAAKQIFDIVIPFDVLAVDIDVFALAGYAITFCAILGVLISAFCLLIDNPESFPPGSVLKACATWLER